MGLIIYVAFCSNKFTHNLKIHFWEVAGLLLQLVSYSCGMSYGAPNAACRTMFPQHGTSAMTGVSPYRIIASPSSVNSSGIVSVRIEMQDGAQRFRGFIIQAKPTLLSQKLGQKPIGAFKFTEGAQRMNCFGSESSSITHQKAQYFTDVAVEWIPPSKFTGRVTFVGTVVTKFKEIWAGLESNSINVV